MLVNKRFFILILVLLASFELKSQIADNGVGLRFDIPSGRSGPGVELSYQTGVSDIVRIELGLGYQTSKETTEFLSFSAVAQRVWCSYFGLNGYLGLGFQVGYYSYLYDGENKMEGLGGGVNIQLGCEYDFRTYFDFPLLLSFDARPLRSLNPMGPIGMGPNIAVRYIWDY